MTSRISYPARGDIPPLKHSRAAGGSSGQPSPAQCGPPREDAKHKHLLTQTAKTKARGKSRALWLNILGKGL